MIDISAYTVGNQLVLRHMNLKHRPDIDEELRPYYGKTVTITQIDCMGEWIKFDGNQWRFSPDRFDPPEPPDASELGSFIGF